MHILAPSPIQVLFLTCDLPQEHLAPEGLSYLGEDTIGQDGKIDPALVQEQMRRNKVAIGAMAGSREIVVAVPRPHIPPYLECTASNGGDCSHHPRRSLTKWIAPGI